MRTVIARLKPQTQATQIKKPCARKALRTHQHKPLLENLTEYGYGKNGHTVLNLSFTMPQTDIDKHIANSKAAKQSHPSSLITLSKQKNSPITHHTVLQCVVPNTPKTLKEFVQKADETRKMIAPFQLSPEEFRQNPDGMDELFLKETPESLNASGTLVDAVRTSIPSAPNNPSHKAYPRWTPTGKDRDDKTFQASLSDTQKAGLAYCGFDEVGNAGKPHVTFARMVAGQNLDFSKLPHQPQDFSGQITGIAIDKMGEHGTCIQRIYQADFPKNPQSMTALENLKQNPVYKKLFTQPMSASSTTA